MKRLFYPVLLICISVLTFNCQKEVSTGWTPGSGTSNITATVQGRILDENGSPTSGVTVKVGGKTSVTDSKGFFRINKPVLDKNAALVVAEKTGYFKAYRTFIATSGANHVEIKLIKKVLTGTISSSSGGEVVLSNGSKVALPVDAVVKAAGGTYSGTINIYAAYIDPTATDISQTVPGSFMADDKNNKRVTLNSYGMLAVELETSSGERLQIANGKMATLTTAIPASIQSSAPASIALWYVDEQTGIWKEEGTAVKNGNNYVGDVKHFSFWNCDVGVPAITLSMTLKTPAGEPIPMIQVKLTRTNGNARYAWTDSLGRASGLVPANETFQMDVLSDCNTVIYSANIGPFSQDTDIGVITISSATSLAITVKGKVVNCNGAPVTSGYAIIDYLWPRYVSVNGSGDFSLVIFSCATAPATVDITAVDNSVQQQATVTVPMTPPITNAGSIVACGTSSAQFINYTFDGANYVVSTPADSLTGYVWSQGPVATSIYGYHSNQDISFGFNSNTMSPGTYPLINIGVQGHYSTQILPPSNAVITTFPAVTGGFFEGSFSGSFKDSINVSLTHTISGTFRVRRNN